MNLDAAKQAVVVVGDGRGFVVEAGYRRLVITAAHCLPHFPPCCGASHLHERTYEGLLGQLGAEPKVWAECRFADPIADIAVLGSPDNQDLHEQAEAYDTLVGECTPLRISDADRARRVHDPLTQQRAWLLSLDGHWFECGVKHVGGPLWLEGADAGIRGGMSGSPIVDRYGRAIGVVCLSHGTDDDLSTEGGPNPRLVNNLPAWLLRELERPPRARRA